MSVETQIQEKIRELLNNINESIPVSWDELYVHVEMSQGGGTVFFDFKSEGESTFHYSVEIPDDFKVSEQIFRQFYREQFAIGRQLWQVFVDNGLPVWSIAIISYINGKMTVKFDYTPWLETKFGPTDRRYFYEYKYLGYQPEDDKEAQKFKDMQALQDQYNDEPL